MANIKHYIDLIVGPAEDFSLQHRIFNSAIFYSFINIWPAALYMLFMDDGWKVSIGLVCYALAYHYIYLHCRYRDNLQHAVFCFAIVGGSLLNIGWLIDAGERGSAVYFAFLIILIINYTAEKPGRYAAAAVVNVVIIAAIDDWLRQFIGFTMPYSRLGQLGSLVTSLGMLAVLSTLYATLVDRKYDDAFAEIIQRVAQESESLGNNADSLAASGEELLALTLQQTTAVEELLATIEQLSATAQQNSGLSSTAMQSVSDNETYLGLSRDNLQQLLSSIDAIKSSSAEIQNINNVVDEIAYQTNLLSLNAMIEASRSGENGGFKVVALEVKKLAERSASAAEGINQLLRSNFDSVKEVGEHSSAMQDRFDEIQKRIGLQSGAMQNVSDASAEQSEAILQISRGIADISHAVDENKHLAEATSTTAKDLKTNAASLMQVVKSMQEIIQS